jgi:hypothetical protein
MSYWREQRLETANIAESPEARGLIEHFRVHVRKFREETGNPWFIEDQELR